MNLPVSVVVPTYNQSRLLKLTLESILSQTYAPAEIVVLDDGSKDDTATVVRSMPPIVRYEYQPNGGICAARNAGASLARSPYLAFCDHDDLWRRDKLAVQMKLHQEAPSLLYSFTNFAIVTDEAWSKESKFDSAPAGFFEGCSEVTQGGRICQDSMYDRLLTFQPIWPSTIVIARELFKSLHGFHEAFGKNPSEDLEFTLRCLQSGPVGVIDQPVVGVRKHATNYSGSNYKNALGQIEILRYALEHHNVAEPTQNAIRHQINARRVDASYAAFEARDFVACEELLDGVPKSYLAPNVRLKQMIARLPLPVARRLHGLLVRR